MGKSFVASSPVMAYASFGFVVLQKRVAVKFTLEKRFRDMFGLFVGSRSGSRERRLKPTLLLSYFVFVESMRKFIPVWTAERRLHTTSHICSVTFHSCFSFRWCNLSSPVSLFLCLPSAFASINYLLQYQNVFINLEYEWKTFAQLTCEFSDLVHVTFYHFVDFDCLG